MNYDKTGLDKVLRKHKLCRAKGLKKLIRKDIKQALENKKYLYVDKVELRLKEKFPKRRNFQDQRHRNKKIYETFREQVIMLANTHRR